MASSQTLNGVNTHRVDSWTELKELFDKNFSKNLSMAFRGQRCESWALTPTITRKLTDQKKFGNSLPISNKGTIERHLELFRKSILGRRGSNPKNLSENDLWALGQHHGLATPLLDWTTSPYVATFFAFQKDQPSNSGRAVWALNLNALTNTAEGLLCLLNDNQACLKNRHGVDREIIEIVRPDNDENERLISQGGLFTKIPFYTSLEQWAAKYMPGYLHKIIIPESERNPILRNLDQMIINDATLFPDLNGASEYCNYMLEIHGNGSLNSSKQQLGGIGIGYDLTDLAD